MSPKAEAKKTFLNRSAILGIVDTKTEEVDVTQWWGCYVMVRSLNASEYGYYQKSVLVQNGKNTNLNYKDAQVKLVILAAINPDGTQMFTLADAPALNGKNAAPINKIFNAATRLSGITEDDIKELTEGLEQDPLDCSPSD